MLGHLHIPIDDYKGPYKRLGKQVFKKEWLNNLFGMKYVTA